MEQLPPRRWLARGVLALVVLALLAPVGVSAVTHDPGQLGHGTVTRPANGTTVIGVQGFHYRGKGSVKKPARLVSVGPDGTTDWVRTARGQFWIYDVDPLPNGNLLVTSTVPGDTIVYELDPATRERVWTQRLDAKDTHDVDLLPNGNLLGVEKSNATDGVSGDRIFVYNRTQEKVVWDWTFRAHYPNETDGGMSADWTHVNDVDRVRPGEYLVSPRNFDQVILVNRTTGDIEWRLGADGDHSVLNEQHNPDYLQGQDGKPTVLVADSENDRVVEYACVANATDPVAGTGPGCSWTRQWAVTGFNWPRDADRLPNGNTLVVDTLDHRVVEITPRGKVVWEYFAPWAPYDAERGKPGSNGPTMREQGVSGTYEVHGGAGTGPASGVQFSEWLERTTNGTAVATQGKWFANRYAHVTPFVRPVWMSSWAFASLALALLVLLGWAVAEGVYNRRAIRRGLGRLR
ncbi:MAG: aryl-sulfate sulfotransferase [Haloarculaceae archaeon]